MAEKLKECQKKAENFNSVFNLSTQTDMKNAISYLNSTLSERVHVALRAVSHETERLQALSGKERKDLDGLQENIQSVLSALGNCVNEKIQKDIENLVKQLKEGVKTILGHLKDIDGRLRQYVQKLEEWMESAKKEIDRIRNEDVKKILDETTDGITGTKYLIEKDAEKLKEWEKKLSALIGSVKIKLAGLAQEALGKVVILDRAVRTGLKTTKDNIQNGIDNYVKKQLLTDIREQIGQITNYKTGLQKVEEEVKQWASDFKTAEGFGDKVKEWIKDILDENEMVRGMFDKWIEGNKVYLDTLYLSAKDDPGSRSQFNAKIAEAIRQKLQTEIIEDMDFEDAAQKNVHDNLEKVEGNITEFLILLGEKLKPDADDDDDNTIVDSVVKAIDEYGEQLKAVFKNRPKNDQEHLQGAIILVITALQSTASRVKEYLAWLTGVGDKEGNIGKVDDTLDVAEQLFEKLRTAIDLGTGDKPYNVNEQILGVLNKQIGEDATGHGRDGQIENVLVTNFQDYEDQIKHDAVANGTLSGTTDEGKLPEAIGAIKEEAAGMYITHITDGLTTLSSDLTTHLEVIMDAITTTTKNVQSKLDDFKNKNIGNAAHSKPAQKDTLQELHCKFLDLHKYFESKALKTAEAFAAYADRSGDNIINPLKQHVNNEVKKAQDSIIAEAKKNYISSIQSLLQRFASKVHGELETLPKSIEDDLTLGFKGFMVKLEQHFVNTVKHIKNISSKSAVQTTEKGRKIYPFSQAVLKLRTAFSLLMSHLESQEDFTSDFERVKMANSALVNLLNKLATSQHYDHTFSNDLDELKKVIEGFKPSTYGEAKCPLLLNTLKNGFTTLVTELNNAYISTYDSETFNGELVKNLQHVSSTSDVNMKYDLTDEGTRLSKVFLTVLRTIDVSLHTLKSNCRVLQKKRINKDTDIGRLFAEMGYVVSNVDDQNGELQDKSEMTGEHILGRLIGRSGRVYSSHDDKNYEGALKDLVTYLKHYFEVCHFTIRPRPRTPCNVYEMLVWLTGLPHNPVYDALLEDGLSAPFKDPAKQTKEAGDGFEFTVFDLQTSHIDAYPSNITYKNTARTIDHICSKAYDVLATIVGHGNASTVYACDFPSNTLNLKYPAGGEDCLNTLLDILRRLLPQLQYLFHRCNVTDTYYGWRNCRYGRDVPTAKWPCIGHSSDKAKHEATCQASCQANTQLHCQPTSPLMSYLNDCLSAHLPHQIVTVGCKSECKTCPSNSPGMPCRMPFGFRGFSGSTKTGMAICESLRLFLGSGLVSSLLCLIPRPPSTLPEHFNFALSLVDKWNGSASHVIKDAFEASIVGSSIGLYKQPSSFTKVLSNAYGSRESTHARESHPISTRADLLSLAKKESCIYSISDNVHCAPYLSSVCSDFYHYLAIKHADLYLSWAVYLPWTLYKYLKSLLDAFCNISCKDWECSRCTHGDKCKPGKHGVGYSCTCKALVHCRGVMSTFYSYGFAFGNPQTLLATDGRRYCHSFYNQLNNVLNSVCFKDLLQKCDEFIFTIRQPFIWLNVALWSLSLFYLLCVMVGRLDVLHIRSHLRSPSSHRITAQSLLAAAQVGRLAKISYLQP
ncbi:hypothetical protein, conserved [Babesia bigemina]|uniref:C3H1-type domain-containing protein n=1 Tax=Babesia bigemina TaxID=5866 RepID=A0A061BLN5_BABBI|nr:hypothetical protein, conserved [Babesia bigemina]CDR71786.1 hypothetical protein, conserved [Babesia bigemina]|eukprot:XP_012770730.1 hypothetical protein, conserved [Babesia bigemina]